MSSSYQLCPALKQTDGYLVIRRVEKAYPVFLRCDAAYFPLQGADVPAMLAAAETCSDLTGFSTAAARLVSQPMLQPFDGGVPVLLYVARPGREDLFREFAEGLDQADDFALLKSLPPEGPPLALVFGDPALPLGQPAPFDPTATAVRLQPVAPAEPSPAASAAANNLAEPEMQPLPVERTLAASPPEADLIAPEAVVAASMSALDDLLRRAAPEAGEPNAPAVEPEDPTEADPSAEPALEVLLRQSPRLQAPDLELDTSHLAPAETGLRPSPHEVLAAVRQVVTALDEALRRQSSEHQNAIQAVMVAAEQHSRALEVRQTEQWERQQAALRQMHAEQVTAIQSAIVRLDEERAAWQQQAVREIQQASAQQLPGALRQFQDELAARQQQSLQKLSDDLLQRQPAAPAGPLTSDAEMQNLNWQLEKSAVSSQDLRLRVGQLLWVNVVLMLILIGLAVGAFWLARGGLAPAPVPTATTAATVPPPTPVPPTPVPPTAPPSTATTAPTPTMAATALPLFVAALTCANTDRPRNFYDCVLTNRATVNDTLALAVQPAGEERNGFNALVIDEELQRITPDAVTGLFSLGVFRPGETRPVRVMLPCAVAAGCGETTFVITPLVDNGQTIVTDQVVEVTTHYFPPDAEPAP